MTGVQTCALPICFHTNLDKENFTEYFKPGTVTLVEKEQLDSLQYQILGTVEGNSCQEDNTQPVPVIGDARTDALHCKVQSLVTALYPTVTIHDFRVIWGVTHSNIVFDAAVPFSVKDSDAVITQKLEAEIQKLDPDYRTVVTIDRR